MKRDFEKASIFFLDTMLCLKRGDRFLLYTDDHDGDATAAGIQAAAREAGIDADILHLSALTDLSAKEKALTGRIASGNYAAACELSVVTFYPTSAWRAAVEKGCRLYSLGAMDEASFIRCVGQVDHQKMHEFGSLLKKLLRESRSVTILSESGTNIRCKMSSRSMVQKIGHLLGFFPSSQVWQPSGMLSEKNRVTFLSGQLAFLGLRESIAGTAVIDGYLWPPDGVGEIDDPIILKIEMGHVTGIEGSTSKSLILRDWLDGRNKSIEHFCLGYNPGAKLGKNLVEAERAFGHITIGIGRYPFHTDGIIKNPTVILDDTIILKDQAYLQTDLRALSKT